MGIIRITAKACDVCGATPTELVDEVGGVSRVKCQACGRVTETAPVQLDGRKFDFTVDGWWFELLHLCGCSHGLQLAELFIDVLEVLVQRLVDETVGPMGWSAWNKYTVEMKDIVTKALGENPLAVDLFWHHLDSTGLIEHGGAVQGSWLKRKDEVEAIVGELLRVKGAGKLGDLG